MTDKKDWPQWLRDAETVDAVVDVVDGCVIWRGGTWRGGTWESGTWRGGIWQSGTWGRGTRIDARAHDHCD